MTTPLGSVEIGPREGRRVTVARTTTETDITVTLGLDGDGHRAIDTGIGFYDHLLGSMAHHGLFDLAVTSDGDLQIDEHHTVEDCALTLGEALNQALGDRRGIGRYGFVLPMDESEARIVLDLSGRASFAFSGQFARDRVGALPTELVPHFFRSLGDALGAAIHVEVRGENTHHMVEACFKSLGRALRQAIRVEGVALPSTKGVL